MTSRGGINNCLRAPTISLTRYKKEKKEKEKKEKEKKEKEKKEKEKKTSFSLHGLVLPSFMLATEPMTTMVGE